MSAQKQTIGIPRVSRNIVRELRELDEAIQSAVRLDDDPTGGESQRDEYLIDNLPDTHVLEALPVVGRSSSSRASRKSQRRRVTSLEEAVKKTVLLAATIESNGSPVRQNKLPSPDIDFILSDLNRAVPTVQAGKSPGRSVPMTPRVPVKSKEKSKEHTATRPTCKDSKSIKEEPDKKVSKEPLENDDWNPFDSSTFVTSWAFETKFNEAFPKSSFVADFDDGFVISSQLSM